jgi:diadenosine tetraphosphate (Ap4A) HIT family hydrolase
MVNNDCTICSELRGEDENNLIFRLLGKEFNSIIKKTDNFAVIPTIGQIVEGYIMVVPLEHYNCIAGLPGHLFEEFDKLKMECIEALFKIYGKRCICFEHGAVGTSFEKKAGCCTDHAHLHIVPVEIDLLREIEQIFKSEKIETTERLSEKYKKGIPYLFFENSNREMYVFEAPLVESQYFRKLVAKNLGLIDKWDWRSNPGKYEIIATTEKLRKILR